jgi:hypothetical protein
MEDLESRLGTATDHDIDLWIFEGVWYTSVAFDGETHECVCGADVETPVERSTEDLRYIPDSFNRFNSGHCLVEPV